MIPLWNDRVRSAAGRSPSRPDPVVPSGRGAPLGDRRAPAWSRPRDLPCRRRIRDSARDLAFGSCEGSPVLVAASASHHIEALLVGPAALAGHAACFSARIAHGLGFHVFHDSSTPQGPANAPSTHASIGPCGGDGHYVQRSYGFVCRWTTGLRVAVSSRIPRRWAEGKGHLRPGGGFHRPDGPIQGSVLTPMGRSQSASARFGSSELGYVSGHDCVRKGL